MRAIDFLPLPLLSNPHLQTILGNLFVGDVLSLPSQRVNVPLPDGDRLVLHETCPDDWHEGRPQVLLVHGLGGSHHSPYMQRLTQRFGERGMRVFRMDLRGAGAGVRLAQRFYNAALSGDVRAAAEAVSAMAPESPLWVVGFSLGGNLVLNFASEANTDPFPALQAVVAVGPPIDLVRCSQLLERQRWYTAYYVHHLVQQVLRHQRYFPHLPRVQFPPKLTLRDFDDLYTAPRWGFADAMAYYRAASSFPRIAAIQVPTFILTARDDPFIAVEPFETLEADSHIEVHIARWGGHLGFLGPDGRGGIRWAETRVLDWLSRFA
jgi:predicted alpha/beta-fold hydrolase